MGIFLWIGLALNGALLGLQAAGVTTPTLLPIATGFESALTPVLSAIQNGSSSLQDAQAGLGGLIGMLTTLKQSGELPADIAGRVDAYITAAENGLAALAKSQKGLDLADLTPLTPLA